MTRLFAGVPRKNCSLAVTFFVTRTHFPGSHASMRSMSKNGYRCGMFFRIWLISAGGSTGVVVNSISDWGVTVGGCGRLGLAKFATCLHTRDATCIMAATATLAAFEERVISPKSVECPLTARAAS